MNDKRRKVLVSLFNTLIPVVFALSTGAVFLLISGNNPLEVYANIIKWSFLDKVGLTYTFAFAAPISMTGLAIAIAYKGGTFNLGVEGQLYVGAFFATYLGFAIEGLPRLLHISICILGGALAGMLLALIPAVMKAFFRISEVVTTIMINNVAIIFTTYLTNGPFTANAGFTATYPVNDTAKLSRLYGTSRLSTSIFIAIGIFVIVWTIMKKSKLGFEIEALGRQKEFSDAMGMKFHIKTIILFLISGAIAGVAGTTEILGVHYRFTPSFSSNPGTGWQGVQVANLAGRSPVGVIIVSIFFGAFKYGGTCLQTRMGVSPDLVNIIQSSLILFIAVRYVKQNSKIFDILKPKKVASTEQGVLR